MNWSKKNRFVRDVARGAVGTKADAMAANTSSFAIILAYCLGSEMMAVDRRFKWLWIAGCKSSVSAAAPIPLYATVSGV